MHFSHATSLLHIPNIVKLFVVLGHKIKNKTAKYKENCFEDSTTCIYLFMVKCSSN